MELTDNTYSGSEPPFRQVSSTGLRVHALGDPRDTAEVRRIVVAAVVAAGLGWWASWRGGDWRTCGACWRLTPPGVCRHCGEPA